MQTQLAENSTLGRYTVLKQLGRGGMADVYLAELKGPAGFHKTVALKVMRNNTPTEHDSLAREARLASQLRHPNIVDIYELGVENRQTFLAMEYVDGPTLSDILKFDAELPASVCLDIALAVARALQRAHAPQTGTPLFHCDIKPSNILLSRDGEVKLTDFGIAVVSGHNVHSQYAEGTPPFMAPEQCTGQLIDARTDIFAFGIVLAMLLLRRYPLDAPVRDLLKAGPLPACLLTERDRAGCDKIIRGAGGVVARCLHSSVIDRYQGMDELLAGLEALREFTGYEPSLRDWIGRVYRAKVPSPHPPKRRLSDTAVVGHATITGHSLDPMIGRDDLLQQLVSELDAGVRLLTLTGTAGVGKTVVLQHLHDHLTRADNGGLIYAPIPAGAGVLTLTYAVAHALRVQVPQESDLDALLQLVRAKLGKGPTRLMLDGVDGMMSGVTEVIEKWLDEAPSLQIVLTSRGALGLSPERDYEVPPLKPNMAIKLAQMLVDAAAVNGVAHPEVPDHELRDLVAEVGGIPSRLMIAVGRLMRGGARSGHTPQLDDATVEADLFEDAESESVDRLSYLEPWERETLGNLTAFFGSIPTSAALQVAAATTHANAPWPVDILERLVALNVLCKVPGTAEARVRINSSVFAEVQATLAPTPAAYRQLGAWYSQFAAEMTRERFSTLEGRDLLWMVQQEQGTLSVVVEHGAPRQAIVCGTLLARTAQLFGPNDLVGSRVEALLTKVPTTLVESWELINIACEAELVLFDNSNIPVMLQAALTDALASIDAPEERRLRDWPPEPSSDVKIRGLIRLAARVFRNRTGVIRPDLLEHLAQTLLIADAYLRRLVNFDDRERLLALGEVVAERTTSVTLRAEFQSRTALMKHMAGDLAAAQKGYESALELQSSCGDTLGAQGNMVRLGQVLNTMGDVTGARRHLREALRLANQLGRPDLTTRAMCGLAYSALYAQENQHAVDLFLDCGQRFQQLNNAYGYYTTMYNCVCAMIDCGRNDDALAQIEALTDDALKEGYPGLYAAALSIRSWLRVCMGTSQDEDASFREAGPVLRPAAEQFALFLCRRGEANLALGRRKDALADLAKLKSHTAEHEAKDSRVLRVIERFEGRVRSRWTGFVSA